MTLPHPGEPSPQEKIKRMIRVNHAGELGAVRIYKGQLAILGKTHAAPKIEHMLSQEEAHFNTFDRMIAARQVRPTILSPLWHLAGYALGAGTALLGEKAAMACTIAVEDVIDEHYRNQLKTLPPEEQDLKETIETFRQEELEHRNEAFTYNDQQECYPKLQTAIRAGSRIAIWLSERF